MAERWAHIKAELIAGAPTCEDEAQAFLDAEAQTVATGEPRVVVRLIAEIKPDPRPPVIVNRYE